MRLTCRFKAIYPQYSWSLLAPLVLCLLAALSEPAQCFAGIKLWPFIEIERDPVQQQVEAKVLGPFIQYKTNPRETALALRPLSLYRSDKSSTRDRRQLWVLYPLLRASRDGAESTVSLLGGLASYRSARNEAGKLARLRLRILPLVFLDWSRPTGLDLSVLPFYGHLENQLNFREIKTLMFPAYLRLTKGLWHRRYYLFPFFGTVSGPDAGGFRLWPVYGKRRLGNDESGFIAWPFYVWAQRLAPGREEKREVFFPIMTRLDSEQMSSRGYGLFLFTHTVNHAAGRESFGFPWPFSVYEKDTSSGTATTLRLFPFYQAKIRAGGASRFFAWPLFRRKSYQERGYSYDRTDFLLSLSRWEETSNKQSSRTTRLRTLFPLYRDWSDGSVRSAGVPALLDSLFPANPVILDLYAPLWQLWSYTHIGSETEWSLVWGAISRKQRKTRYPWQWW